MATVASKGLWQQLPRPEREALILAAGIRLFTEHGYANVSMDSIAEQAGITKPLVYTYFGSKEGLYAACITAALESLAPEIASVVDREQVPEERLRNGALAVFRFVGAHRDEWQRFYIEPAAHGPEAAAAVTELRERAVDRLVAMFAQAMRDSGLPEALEPEIRPQVYIFIGGVESLARWWVEHPDDATAELLALRVVNQAWQGFGNLLEGRLLSP